MNQDPFSTLKRVAIATLKAPAAVAGAVVGLAQTASRRARGAASAPQEAPTIPPDEPVNVVEALGLDPAPATEPPARKAAAPEPVTRIDAEADPDHVDATPADIAEAVKKD